MNEERTPITFLLRIQTAKDVWGYALEKNMLLGDVVEELWEEHQKKLRGEQK